MPSRQHLAYSGPKPEIATLTDDEDHAALLAARAPGVALCTIVGIDGSFSRRLGAQLAILPDGSFAGSLADGCLEQQLRTDCARADGPVVRRYGRGSELIDFRLPCGGGLDILIDPSPDRAACERVAGQLARRQPASLALPDGYLPQRSYIPRLVLRLFGEGPEVAAMAKVAASAGIACEVVPQPGLSLGQPSGLPRADRWTAVVLLFHDHEWEAALLAEALASEAFYIGAQGGLNARAARIAGLKALGFDEQGLIRLRSPIGLSPGSRSPQTLALSVLAEITGEYDRLRPHD